MRTVLLLVATALLAGCPEPDGGFSRDLDDPTPTPTPEPEPDGRLAHLDFDRLRGDTGEVQTSVRASFHADVVQPLHPPLPPDLDSCEAGSAPNTSFDLPAHSLDVGDLLLVTDDGDLPLSFDGTHWTASLPGATWIPNFEIGFRVTGGDDLPAQGWADQLGTPALLELDGVEATDDGLLLQWTGGNNDGDIALYLVHTPGDELVWISCKLFDDGEQLIAWDDLDGLDPGELRLELRRQTSTVFAIGDGEGNATGASIAVHRFDWPEVAADDDDSGGR